jgi:flagellin-like hook-associated protein FlgL
MESTTMGSDVSLSKAVRANLLSLQNTASMMDKTQNRLATGNKVNSALDNPSNFFTASALNSRAADMSNLLDSMASGIKVIEAANNGITALTKNLESMQSTLRQARQDKSFQTQSFEVTDASVINLSGGQFGEVSSISLAAATKEGSKATLVTSGTTPYTGPSSSADGASGAGARRVINFDSATNFAAGDTFKVAGVDVSVSDVDGNAGVDIADVVKNIQDALDDSDAVGKYKVTAGTVGNSKQIIIESVDPNAAAASVEFGNGGVNLATKGTTSFKYSAITSTVKIGDQTISTGTSAAEFKQNLEAHAKAGGYEVAYDTDTETFTLTSSAWGGASPIPQGIPANVDAVGDASETTFQLTKYEENGDDKLLSNQKLSITPPGGTAIEVTLTAGMSLSDVEAAFEAAGVTDLYEVEVGADFAITLTDLELVDGKAGPAVTSNLGSAANPTPSTFVVDGTIGVDSSDDAELASLDGSTITTADGKFSFTFDSTDADIDTFAKVFDALDELGFTVAAPAAGLQLGLNISRADGKNFIITDASGTAFGGLTNSHTTANGAEVPFATNPVSAAGDVTTPAVNGYTTNGGGVAGVSLSQVPAEKDTFTVTYGGKSVEISIGGVKGGVGSSTTRLDIEDWRDATIAQVNEDLEAGGITGIKASFDESGKLQFQATTAEVETLSITGPDAVALFGQNAINTGKPEKVELNATKTVDRFVELINKTVGSKVRASNDNGKLRIENLSTQDLNVGVDKNGNDNFQASNIAGNTVRTNLHTQFNELRDQLDKLADDSSFNGINLLRGDKLKITFNESGTSAIDIQAKDANGNVRGINASNLGVDSLVAEDLDTDEKIDAFLAKLSSALTELRSQASSFGSNLSSVENRQSFTKNMINTLETGAANLTLADTNEEAANLLALQTRQQLSSSALSMASQQDQAVLQLLR